MTPSSDSTVPQTTKKQGPGRPSGKKSNEPSTTDASSSEPQTERPLRSKDKEQQDKEQQNKEQQDKEVSNKKARKGEPARTGEQNFENAKQKVQRAFTTVETCKRKDTEASEALRKAELDIAHMEGALRDLGIESHKASKALDTAQKQLTIAVEQHHRDNIDDLTEKLREASEKLLDKTTQFNNMQDAISEAREARQVASVHSAKMALQYAEATQMFASASME